MMQENSVSMPNAPLFAVNDRCRKHLVFVDVRGAVDAAPDIREMTESEYPVEWNGVVTDSEAPPACEVDDRIAAKHWWATSDTSHALTKYLQNQPIGTHLYVAATWATARWIAELGDKIGYAKEDMQIRGYGREFQQVFCIGCYTVNAIDGEDSIMTCKGCGRLISISHHYSARLDAVLGTLVLDDATKKGKL